MKPTLLSATCLSVGLLVTTAVQANDNPGTGETIELYALTTDLSATLSSPPQPGEFAAFGRDLYMLGGTPAVPIPVGSPIGRNLIFCIVVTSSEAICHGQWSLDGRGIVSGSTYLDLTMPPGVEAPLTGGSGEFAGAAGVIENRPVPGAQDQVWVLEIAGFNQP